MAPASVMADVAADRRASFGHPKVFRDVLEHVQASDTVDFGAIAVWSAGGVGYEPVPVQGAQDTDDAVHNAYAYAVSGDDGAELSCHRQPRADGHTVGGYFAICLFGVPGVHYDEKLRRRAQGASGSGFDRRGGVFQDILQHRASARYARHSGGFSSGISRMLERDRATNDIYQGSGIVAAVALPAANRDRQAWPVDGGVADDGDTDCAGFPFRAKIS